MKAFRFRLDQVMKWRASQLDVEKGKLAAAAARLADLRRGVVSLETQLVSEGSGYQQGTTGVELGAWDGYYNRTKRQIAELQAKEPEAEAAIAVCRQALVEADRRFRLLENLRRTRHERWVLDWNRELEAFAAESFLIKLQLENGRARSSSG